MTLPAGSRLGPYEILSAVGAGGMGEVYKARDVRLERTVAVKVLPASLSENPAFRQRFEREAKAISQLSHPHICTVHDVGNEAGVEYLVMEFLEGETLANRIAKGPLPLDQVLRYGIEIADALEKAHRHGVVHRDLKPGNVMLTKSGVKLVDFGLAKLDLPAPGSVAASLSDVLTQGDMNLSAQGTIVGTLHYMSPEQLEGGEADGRTDIFGLGLLLFEMTTGKKAFTGKSPASLMAAILHTEPEPDLFISADGSPGPRPDRPDLPREGPERPFPDRARRPAPAPVDRGRRFGRRAAGARRREEEKPREARLGARPGRGARGRGGDRPRHSTDERATANRSVLAPSTREVELRVRIRPDGIVTGRPPRGFRRDLFRDQQAVGPAALRCVGRTARRDGGSFESLLVPGQPVPRFLREPAS